MQCLHIWPCLKRNVYSIDQSYIIYRLLEKKANSCNWNFYQYRNQKYLQIWLLLKFPNISGIFIVNRLSKKQELFKGWSWTFYKRNCAWLLDNASFNLVENVPSHFLLKMYNQQYPFPLHFAVPNFENKPCLYTGDYCFWLF